MCDRMRTEGDGSLRLQNVEKTVLVIRMNVVLTGAPFVAVMSIDAAADKMFQSVTYGISFHTFS